MITNNNIKYFYDVIVSNLDDNILIKYVLRSHLKFLIDVTDYNNLMIAFGDIDINRDKFETLLKNIKDKYDQR